MKTAIELGITDKEWTALWTVREGLSKGLLKHAADEEEYSEKEEDEFGNAVPVKVEMGFNMGLAGTQRGCGSVACIGGWMAAFMIEGFFSKKSAHKYDRTMDDYVWGKACDIDDLHLVVGMGGSYYTRSPALHPLFFPKGLEQGDWDKLQPDDALSAIDNFFATGDPAWPTVRPDLDPVDEDMPEGDL